MPTLKQIKQYVEGYSRMYYNMFLGLPKHQKEQIEYRMFKCKDDCAKQGSCIKCGCDYPGKIFVSETCNESRFPDFMNSSDWEQYKIDNNITNG